MHACTRCANNGRLCPSHPGSLGPAGDVTSSLSLTPCFVPTLPSCWGRFGVPGKHRRIRAPGVAEPMFHIGLLSWVPVQLKRIFSSAVSASLPSSASPRLVQYRFGLTVFSLWASSPEGGGLRHHPFLAPWRQPFRPRVPQAGEWSCNRSSVVSSDRMVAAGALVKMTPSLCLIRRYLNHWSSRPQYNTGHI